MDLYKRGACGRMSLVVEVVVVENDSIGKFVCLCLYKDLVEWR